MDDYLESSISIDNKRRLSKNRRKLEDYCPFDIPGVTKLKLSAETQNAIGCVVGDQVSAESPWTIIKKELIEENIEHNGEEAELFLLKEKIHEYVDTEIYVGWVPLVSDVGDFFYIVYTLEARDKIERIIQRQKAELQRRVDKLIYRPVGQWKNLGSDKEVDENLIKGFRSLYEVQLKTRFPLKDTIVSFNLKRVEEIENGYVELLPEERFNYELIKRKRVDVAVQAISNKISQYAQTSSTYPKNIWTQYNYEYTPPKLEDDPVVEEHQDKRKQPKIKKVYPKFKTDYMTTTVDELKEHIKVNNLFNIYQDDYASLALKSRRSSSLGRILTLASFTEQQLCRKKFVSSCCWDPFKSGILAVSYSSTTLNLISSQSFADEALETTFGYCPVLIWSYNNTLHPKLYLQTPRQITSLSFCPYEKDILVGGCTNGQIVIWNLKNKLVEAEKIEVMTPKQAKARMIFLDILNWKEGLFRKTMVQPAIVSSHGISQKDMITAIYWVPQNVKISSEGKCDAGASKQFLSCSLDGTIAVWDMETREKKLSVRRRKNSHQVVKVTRLKKRPDALSCSTNKTEKIGPQVYTFKLSEKDKFPVCSMLEMFDGHNYKPIGNVDPNPKVRTEFELEEDRNKMELNIFFTSSLGKVAKVDIVDIDELDLNSEEVERLNIKEYAPIHDGPIITSQTHPHFRDNFLTIGGTVFAIWNISLFEPILWIRAPPESKYISGGWAEKNPSYFILICSDGSCQLWDLLNSKNCPIKVIPFGSIMSIFGTTNLGHSRKETFAISDALGTLTIWNVPEILSLFEEDKLEKTRKYFDRAINRRNFLKDWIDRFYQSFKTIPLKKNSFKTVVKSGRISRASTKITEIEKMDKIFIGVQWKTMQEEAIFNTMLELKGLNLEELEQYKYPLQEKALLKRAQALKREQRLLTKPIIIKNSKALILPKIEFGKERKFSLPLIENAEDCSYIKDYEEIEKRALCFIKTNEYKMEFSFNEMVENARLRRQKTAAFLKQSNVHKRN